MSETDCCSGAVSPVRRRRTQVSDYLDLSTQWFVVLWSDVQLQSVGVLHVRATRRALLGAVRYHSGLERTLRHHQLLERIGAVSLHSSALIQCTLLVVDG